jgi:hypothetical protein
MVILASDGVIKFINSSIQNNTLVELANHHGFETSPGPGSLANKINVVGSMDEDGSKDSLEYKALGNNQRLKSFVEVLCRRKSDGFVNLDHVDYIDDASVLVIECIFQSTPRFDSLGRILSTEFDSIVPATP